MKDKRIISIKNSKLRKLRDELRLLLIRATQTEWKRFFDEMQNLQFDRDNNRRTVDDMSQEELIRFRELQRLKSENRKMGERSICICFNCGRADQDMYYNHPYRAWFCVECAGFLKEGYAKIKVKQVSGEYTCDTDDEFGHSFF